MEKKNIRGRDMYLGVSTEELIVFFKNNPGIELECSSGITRWLKYDRWHSRIGITDDIHYDWYSLTQFRKYYGTWYWNFFIM